MERVMMNTFSMDRFPLDLVSRILSFLDGEGLLACSSVCTDFCQLTDQRSYWENAAWKLYPHLKETYDIMPYNGDWKALFKDRNRRNRSAVFEWTVSDFLSNPERRYSPSFRVENYNFKVIVDPVGNPNVYFLEPGVSVYLACSLASPVGGPAGAAASDEENESGTEWECCCAFSLTACNQQRKGRNVTWHSSMHNDRFHKNRKNWGVHSLLPLTKLKDPASGFVVDDSLKLKVRLRLLYLTVKVIRSTSLAAHRGFGVVDTGAEADSKALCYELFHCTTLAKFKDLLVKDLGLPSPDHLRLWVFTQPWPDTVLCPREILVNEPIGAPAQAAGNNNNGGGPDTADDDLSSPTLFSLLQLHMDGLGVARVWAECSDDGGFSSASAIAADNAVVVAQSGGIVTPPPAAAAAAASTASSSTTLTTALDVPGIHRCLARNPLSTVPLWPDSRDVTSQQAMQAAAASSSTLGDLHVLIFIKWLNPRTAEVAYLTHVVIKVHTPLHQLFSLVSNIVQQTPQSLVAHVETTPANWQPGSNAMHRSITCPGFVADQIQGGSAGGQTLRDVGIENGQILTFHLIDMTRTLEGVYRRYLEGLFREAYLMYYGEGRMELPPTAAGQSNGSSSSLMMDDTADSSDRGLTTPSSSFRRHTTLKLEDVVNLFERFGYQSFRVRNVYYQHKHMNARQTLEYVIQGRHLGFCCDRCGATDFTGPRYKCMSCYDYDLCSNCQGHPQAAAHRYKYEHRGWRRENHFMEHNKVHKMHMILPVPCKLHLLHL